MILEPAELKRRGDAIGYKLSQIARQTGVHPTGAYRAARDGKEGPEMRYSSLQAMTNALVERELDLLRHLAELYPEEIARLAARRPSRRGRAA